MGAASGTAPWNAGTGRGWIELRDYFAGQAMAGFVARGCVADAIRLAGWSQTDGYVLFARGVYELADAMIAARDKQ